MNLCITLVIYQESLHDARSTKCKKKNRYVINMSEFFFLMVGILIIYHSPVRPVKVKTLKVTL